MNRTADPGEPAVGVPCARLAATTAEEAARVRLSANPKTRRTVLASLTADPSLQVRAALAMNPALPASANQLLAADADDRVRSLLGRKLAALVPVLSAPEQAKLYQQTYDTLVVLVSDTAERVRADIADVLKDLANAPRELILRLARDASMRVSEPILRLSPLLTVDDLLGLLAQAPTPARARAVARRPGLNAAISDAIVATADDLAIRALLTNRSAQIREATLEALIVRAADHIGWHEPLVRRPSLTPRGAQALSRIVADHLLEILANRGDLTAELVAELRQRLADRMAAPPDAPADVTAGHSSEDTSDTPPALDAALTAARSLAYAGQLTEATVLAAARRGNARTIAALLAIAADVPIEVVERAASLRSAKGLISLTWKAGFSMRAAVALQTVLAHLPPGSTLGAGAGGAFPLAVAEMRWQLDFLGRPGR